MATRESDALPPRTVAYSAVRDQVYMVFPNDLNANDTVFGGLIMAQMDRFAAVVADRHAGGVCVTASVDAVHFIAPARRGDVLIFNASVNRAWTTSMEVGVKVNARGYDGNNERHILSAYLTFVAVDPDGKPRPVPALQPESDLEYYRYQEAQLRREMRLQHAEALKKLRGGRPARRLPDTER